jgi:hypothetical protein
MRDKNGTIIKRGAMLHYQGRTWRTLFCHFGKLALSDGGNIVNLRVDHLADSNGRVWNVEVETERRPAGSSVRTKD